MGRSVVIVITLAGGTLLINLKADGLSMQPVPGTHLNFVLRPKFSVRRAATPWLPGSGLRWLMSAASDFFVARFPDTYFKTS